MRRRSAALKTSNGLLMTGRDADRVVLFIFFFPHLLQQAVSGAMGRPSSRRRRRSRLPPTSSTPSVPSGSQKRPRIADEAAALWLACLFPSASIFPIIMELMFSPAER